MYSVAYHRKNNVYFINSNKIFEAKLYQSIRFTTFYNVAAPCNIWNDETEISELIKGRKLTLIIWNRASPL